MEQALQLGSERLRRPLPAWRFFLPVFHPQGMKRLNASLSNRQRALLSSYMLSIKQGPAAVRGMVMFDMRGFLDLGISERAADLMAVLDAFAGRYPEAAGKGKLEHKQNLSRHCNDSDLSDFRADNRNRSRV